MRILDEGPGIPPTPAGASSSSIGSTASTRRAPARPAAAASASRSCGEIARAHGGRVWTEPGPHGGSLFTLAVPGAPDAESPTARRRATGWTEPMTAAVEAEGSLALTRCRRVRAAARSSTGTARTTRPTGGCPRSAAVPGPAVCLRGAWRPSAPAAAGRTGRGPRARPRSHRTAGTVRPVTARKLPPPTMSTVVPHGVERTRSTQPPLPLEPPVFRAPAGTLACACFQSFATRCSSGAAPR